MDLTRFEWAIVALLFLSAIVNSIGQPVASVVGAFVGVVVFSILFITIKRWANQYARGLATDTSEYDADDIIIEETESGSRMRIED